MKTNYCLPIIKSKKVEVLHEIQSNKNSDFYEIWLDYISDLDEAFVSSLLTDYEDKLIFLFRRQQLESPHMERIMQENIIKLIDNKKAMIDIDISQHELHQFIKNNNLTIKLLGSYHNYEHTPDDTILNSIVHEIKQHNPDIIKIATLCKSESDAVRLLALLIMLQEHKEKYIIIGMGEFGTITRLAGALWGNEMTFAPVESINNSAPGQITKSDFELILKIINKKN